MSGSPGKAFLISGTQLSVGKTFVAAGLARLLKERGYDVGVMKPIEVGWPKEQGEWPHDAESLKIAAGSDDGLEDVAPYVFDELMAPQLAADRERNPIELEHIKECLDRLRSRHDIVLVEGVGGLAVPLDEGQDYTTLAKLCDLPVLLVTAAHMGTLNSTYLSVHYAKSQGLNVLGAVANRQDRTLDDPTTSTNALMIERMCNIPVLGVLPFRPEADSMEDIVSTCRDCFDLDKLIDALGLGAPAAQ